MDFKSLLSGDVAGVPKWLIAVGGGVAIWFFFLRGSGSTSPSSSGVSADSAYGLGYAQGLQAAKANGTAGSAPQPTPGPQPQPVPPPPWPLPPITPPSQSPPDDRNTNPIGGFSSQGTRSAQWVGNYFHPAITRRVVYSHYVRAIGGPAVHRSEISRVSRSSGIHEARLQMLNPVHTGRIRIA